MPKPERSDPSPAALPLVRASDLAAWAYCRRAWWLARVQSLDPPDSARLQAGTAHHRAHGRGLAAALTLQRLGWLLMAGALLMLLLGLLLVVAR